MRNLFRAVVRLALVVVFSGVNVFTVAARADQGAGVPASELQSKFEAVPRFDELDYQNRLKNAEDKNKNLQQDVVILSIVVAVLLALLMYLLYRKVKFSEVQLKELKLKLKYQSKRDPLTGLLNRRAFYETMKKRLKASNRRATADNTAMQALVILDIDQYKLINDTFGSTVGDIVLIEVSHRLADMMRENDKLMRWGGEEFLMYLSNVTGENLDAIAQRALNTIGQTCIEVDLQHLNVTVSIGYIALEGIADLENSLKLADAALYKAKIDGRNQAIGVRAGTLQKQDLDSMLTTNLDELISQHKVAVTRIQGPVAPGIPNDE